MSFTRGDDEAGGGGASAIYGEIYAADDHSMSLRTNPGSIISTLHHTVTFSAAGVFNCVSLNTTSSYLKIKVAGRYHVSAALNLGMTATQNTNQVSVRVLLNGSNITNMFSNQSDTNHTTTAYQQTKMILISGISSFVVDDKITLTLGNLRNTTGTYKPNVKASSSLAVLYLGETPA